MKVALNLSLFTLLFSSTLPATPNSSSSSDKYSLLPGQQEIRTPIKFTYTEDPEDKRFKDFNLNLGIAHFYNSKLLGRNTASFGTSITVPLLRELGEAEDLWGVNSIGEDIQTENVKMSVDLKLFF